VGGSRAKGPSGPFCAQAPGVVLWLRTNRGIPTWRKGGFTSRCLTQAVAYARFGDECDVYVFSTGGELLCMDCALGLDLKAKSTAVMIAHLDEHVAHGDQVPEDVLMDLRRDEVKSDAEFLQAIQRT
jgi:hypothetical protein